MSTSTMPTSSSQVSERRAGGHSREQSYDKIIFSRPDLSSITGINGTNGVSSRSHSRNNSWDSKKNDDLIPQRRTPPSINVLPSSTPSTRRNSNEFSGYGFTSVPLAHSQSHPSTSSSLNWAAEKLSNNPHIQSSKRLLNKINLSKLTTSFSYDSEKQASQYPDVFDDQYCSSPNEKAKLTGQFGHHYPKPAKYHSAFRKAPIGYSLFHLKRLSSALLQPRRLFALLLSILLLSYLFRSSLASFYRSSRFLGGGSKYVIILAANQGGGVLGWKTPKEWYVERESIKNKKAYAARHGYTLEIRDMKSLKRYAHEWRESWEKVDILKQTMKKYPHAEWFWYLDVQTFIMEPGISLQDHIFNRLHEVTFRDINKHNPLNITHPPKKRYLDPTAKSKVGDGNDDSIGLIVPQDCGGFNLGSFFARRSEFTERLLDVWWDPVGYEQMHMTWEHKEQDVLEHIYIHQPWSRNGIAFIPQRMINSFPPGACKEKAGDKNIFYHPEDRDFMVNMAGCEWGRDCADEMKYYTEVSEKLNSKKGLWK
ncbi:hypothetical protein ABW19_dt0206626 [Dactylella cylindrospora]|nr:hypothetical protein ABW19_dt0206626 [Dactylella cylindrospora]